jgi:hypothetical protein
MIDLGIFKIARNQMVFNLDFLAYKVVDTICNIDGVVFNYFQSEVLSSTR